MLCKGGGGGEEWMLSILGRFWVTVSCNRAPILTRRIGSVQGCVGVFLLMIREHYALLSIHSY